MKEKLKLILSKNKYVYVLIFVLSVGISGWNILYFTQIAKSANTPIAKSFPAPINSDAEEYSNIAKNLLNYGVFSIESDPPLHVNTSRTPGYPYLLVVSYKLFNSLYPILIFQMFVLFLTCLLIFKMTEKLVGPIWAIFVVCLYSIDPNTLFAVSGIFTENLFVFFFVFSLYVLFFSEAKNMYLKWGVGGLLLGVATLIRPISLYLPPVFILSYFLFFWKKSDKSLHKHIVSVVIFWAMFFIVIFPWYVRNKEVSGVWGLSSIPAYNLFRHNAALFEATITGRGAGEVRQELLRRAGLPPGDVTKDLKDAEAMEKVAFEVIMEHPVRYSLYHGSSMVSFFLSSGLHQYIQYTKDMTGDYARKPEPSLAQALITYSWSTFVIVIKNHGVLLFENFFWLIINLSLFIGVWRSSDTKISRVFALLVLYFAFVTGPVANARYRIPATPLMFIGAVSSLQFLWLKYKENKSKKLSFWKNIKALVN